MLALKTLAAGGRGAGKTLIFDEVDAGIGGRVADVVGAQLRALGERFQVLCITHLPQIAARATTQFRIEKHVRGERTVTVGRAARRRRAGRGDRADDWRRGGHGRRARQRRASCWQRRRRDSEAKGESRERRKRKSAAEG